MCKMVRGAHEGPVFSILVQKDGAIITGGKDGRIIEWDRDLERTGNVIEVTFFLLLIIYVEYETDAKYYGFN